MRCLVLVLLAGCGSTTTHTMINEPVHAMQPGGLVELYASGPPPRPHQDVALIEVEQQSGYSTASAHDMLKDLRKHAGLMGCDGVVLMQKRVHPAGGGAVIYGRSSNDAAAALAVVDLVLLWQHERIGFTATCFIWTDLPGAIAGRTGDFPRPPPPPAPPVEPNSPP